MTDPSRRASVAMALLVVIWGVNFPVIKGAFGDLPPFVFNALRVPAAAALLAGVAWRLEGRWWPARADVPGLAVLGLVGHVAYQTLFIAGLARTSSVHSSIILAMVPLLVGVLGVALGIERPTGRMWLGLVVAFAGVVVLVRDGAGGAGPSSTLAGDAITFAAASCWAAYTVLARPYLARMSALRVTTATLAMSAPVLAAAGVPGARAVAWAAVGAGSWAALGFSTLFAIVVSYVIWYRSVQLVGGARTAAVSNLIPIVTVAASWAWFGEPPRAAQAVAVGVVLFGVWLARRPGDRAASRTVEPGA
ncbi:MAG: DMT family transporter [Armatimonadota bacterium]|nr:DMT family transporter [Armatimonadota bacterium]MDR7455596.1 DMT family transporter [Armatimonadota bacterium]MDR7496129.1 DMT family transporter [Armatimonadota bacterium]MDR7512617.1 DMT family transporter [Armatimonadota bacterium]